MTHSHKTIRTLLMALLAATLTAVGFFPAPGGGADLAQEWGTVKGKVVWAGGAIPPNPPVAGPVRQATLVINPKNKGVRWVLVWLADPKDATNTRFTPPIHPSLRNIAPTVEIDQPRGAFVPRVIGMQASQNLVVKNSSAIAHVFLLRSIGEGPTANPLIPAGGKATILGFVPKLIPTLCTCGIQRWMTAWIGIFAHPYFAVTDADGNFEIKNAPAGKFQFVVWHEETGFLLQKSKKLRGKVIEIQAKGVTRVGKIDLKLPRDK